MHVATADPLRLLWQHQGTPVPADVSFDPGPATCARCGQDADTSAPLTGVISDKFTGWDDYATGDRNPRWCVACTWGHTEATLRHFPWFVTPERGGRLTPSLLRDLLAAPLDPTVALVVPLSRKKHLLPAARWGVITTDDVHLPWAAADADRLLLLLTLHALGFTETGLLAPAPRFEQLRTLSPDQQALVLTTWPRLAPWRNYPPLMQVALRATRKNAA